MARSLTAWGMLPRGFSRTRGREGALAVRKDRSEAKPGSTRSPGWRWAQSFTEMDCLESFKLTMSWG